MPCPTSPHLALLALLSVAGAVGPGETCPSEVNLIKNRLQVNCSGQGLSVVPLALPRNTSILLLSTNRLASVSTASFQHLPELAELDLSGNGLGALHTGPPLPLLQELVLSHNALGVLPTLQGLPELTRLALDHNNISGLVPGAFRAVGKLKELNLRGNQLQTLPEEAFEGVAGLKDLDLSDNVLDELPQGLLAGLELETLRLSGNQLRTLPSGFFPEGPVLDKVFLEGNPWHCDCGLAYLRGWIADNEFSIYMQEQRSDGLLIENDPHSPVCDAPLRHQGSPVVDLQQACSKAGDADLDINGTMTEEGFPVPSTTAPSTTLPPTTPVPTTTAPEPASPAPPELTSTPMTPTTTLIPSPPFHTSPLHITPCHQAPPPTGATPLCMCPTPPPAMSMAGHQQGREGPQWGHWVLAHCFLLHLIIES